jgi:hypothetical protein
VSLLKEDETPPQESERQHFIMDPHSISGRTETLNAVASAHALALEACNPLSMQKRRSASRALSKLAHDAMTSATGAGPPNAATNPGA